MIFKINSWEFWNALFHFQIINGGFIKPSTKLLQLGRGQSTSRLSKKEIFWQGIKPNWPPDGKSQLIGEDPDAGKDWGQEEKGMTEDEMVGWCHWLSGHEFEQIQEDSEGQGSLVCCSPWGHKESDTIEQLNTTTTCQIFSIWVFNIQIP